MNKPEMKQFLRGRLGELRTIASVVKRNNPSFDEEDLYFNFVKDFATAFKDVLSEQFGFEKTEKILGHKRINDIWL